MAPQHKKALENYVFLVVCPVTALVNPLMVIIDGIICLACEIHIPIFKLVDQDSGIVKE